MTVLAFRTPGLESAFVLRRNGQLLRNDAAWALFWLVFGGAGLGKAAVQPWDRQTLQEAASICAYMAWSPLLLWLIRCRTGFYLRRRSAVLVAMRIVRTMLLMSHLDRRQTLWLGTAASPPATALRVYVHLFHKVNFLLLTSVGVLLPMRLHLPLHLAFLLLMLRATALRCREECALSHAAAAAASGVPAFQPYYALVVQWVRRIHPRTLWRLPPHWRPGGGAADAAGGCLGPCFAVHAFLQSVVGVLMPLAMLWVWEERLRAREIRSWRRALAQQQQQQQQLQQQQEQEAPQQQPEHDAQGPERGEGSQQQLRRRRRWQRQEGSPEPRGSPSPPQGSPLLQSSPGGREGSPPLIPRDLPLPVASTAAWFALSAWLLWQLLEAVLL